MGGAAEEDAGAADDAAGGAAGVDDEADGIGMRRHGGGVADRGEPRRVIRGREVRQLHHAARRGEAAHAVVVVGHLQAVGRGRLVFGDASVDEILAAADVSGLDDSFAEGDELTTTVA